MIEIKITGETASEVLNDLAALANASQVQSVDPSALKIHVPTEDKAPETKKRTTAKKETAAPIEEKAPETPKEEPKKEEGSHGYTYDDVQDFAAKIDDKKPIKDLIVTYKQEDGTPCERMSQIRPVDYAPFMGGLKLILDNQL